jgi:GntR family transcriptional regulator
MAAAVAPRSLDSLSAIPLYHQIANVIHSRIMEGAHPVGSLLPTEEELVEQFQVSRGTIRQAIGLLVQIGVVRRRRGSGTWVIPSQALGQRFRGSLASLIAENWRAQVRDVEVERNVEIPARISALLALREPKGVIVRRVRTMDGQTFGYTVNYMSTAMGRKISEEELRNLSLMWLLESKGIKFVSATQSIRARLADLETSRRLEVPCGAAILFVERVMYGAHRTPVELVQTWYRGDLYEYAVTVNLTRRGEGEGGSAQLA